MPVPRLSGLRSPSLSLLNPNSRPQGNVTFPGHMSVTARDLVRKLLQAGGSGPAGGPANGRAGAPALRRLSSGSSPASKRLRRVLRLHAAHPPHPTTRHPPASGGPQQALRLPGGRRGRHQGAPLVQAPGLGGAQGAQPARAHPPHRQGERGLGSSVRRGVGARVGLGPGLAGLSWHAHPGAHACPPPALVTQPNPPQNTAPNSPRIRTPGTPPPDDASAHPPTYPNLSSTSPARPSPVPARPPTTPPTLRTTRTWGPCSTPSSSPPRSRPCSPASEAGARICSPAAARRPAGAHGRRARTFWRRAPSVGALGRWQPCTLFTPLLAQYSQR